MIIKIVRRISKIMKIRGRKRILITIRRRRRKGDEERG